MKKLSTLIFVILILNGCANQNSPQIAPTKSPQPTINSKKTTAQTPVPTIDVTLQPTVEPTPEPTPEQTVEPTPEPTQSPSPTKKPHTLAMCSTKIFDRDPNRMENLKVAAKAVNGYVVKKGHTFSFNDVVGVRTEKKGYKEAGVLVGKEKTVGLGGGVCQISTTIFQAAQKANLEIVERHTHEIQVVYAKNGTDATVNYNNLDFKFKNISDADVVIKVSVSNSSVKVTIKESI